ncbi:hypothetical protein IWX90DRAFT_192328 [Phyllosticta citrichinensis]|uniref:Uncharacterized protein n=1 Tax=Phyllosticta citrichinensis TaxID=1130410 RepID=A0ABR1XWW3_9PEZI
MDLLAVLAGVLSLATVIVSVTGYCGSGMLLECLVLYFFSILTKIWALHAPYMRLT